MTVEELINKLEQFDRESDVYVEDSFYSTFEAIDVVKTEDNHILITATWD